MHFKYIGCNHTAREKFYEKNLPEGSPTYLFLNIKSKAVFVINGETQIVEPNSIILYNKGTPQHYKYYEDENGKIECYSNDWIHFDADDEEMKEIKIPLDTVIALENTNEISMLIEKMMHIFYTKSEFKDKKMTQYMLLIFYEIADMINKHDSDYSNYQDALYNLRSKLRDDPSFRRSVKWMAGYLNVSESYFQHMYKEVFGVSPTEDCIRGRIHNAKYQLLNSSLNIAQISSLLGYKEQTQFIKQFKKYTGKTPLQYRKTHLNR